MKNFSEVVDCNNKNHTVEKYMQYIEWLKHNKEDLFKNITDENSYLINQLFLLLENSLHYEKNFVDMLTYMNIFNTEVAVLDKIIKNENGVIDEKFIREVCKYAIGKGNLKDATCHLAAVLSNEFRYNEEKYKGKYCLYDQLYKIGYDIIFSELGKTNRLK